METACVFIGFAICSVLVYGLLFYITSFLGPKPRTNGAQSMELDRLLFLGACNLLARDGRMAVATAERRDQLVRLAIADASQVWNTLVKAQAEGYSVPSMPHIFTVEDRALAQWLKAHNITSGHPVFVQFEYQ